MRVKSKIKKLFRKIFKIKHKEEHIQPLFADSTTMAEAVLSFCKLNDDFCRCFNERIERYWGFEITEEKFNREVLKAHKKIDELTGGNHE